MIRQYLENQYSLGRLHSSYLISTDDLPKAFTELKGFVSNNLLKKGELEANPDYLFVKRESKTAKNIAVDQVRSMQEFLYKTSVISGQKIAIIYAADQMNLNAANSCLKILEEPPASVHIFLLTENPAGLLPTIRSRCAKINHHYHETERNDIDERFVKPLLRSTKLSERLSFIKEFASKDREFWAEFTSSIESLIAKLVRNRIGLAVSLTSYEQELLGQLKSSTPLYLQNKYSKIKKIIDQTKEFDLDMKSSCVLLIEQMKI